MEDVFLRHVALLAIVIGHRETLEKNSMNLSQLPFRGTGAACSVAPAMINSTVYIFLRRDLVGP